ncbi:MAG: hypothetical protein RR424_09870 [Oscillospiraceae bacterium]
MKITELENGVHTNFIKKSYDDMMNAFNLTNDKKGVQTVKIISAICSAAGILTALYFNSYMLVPVLGIGLALLPMWVSKFKAYKYRQKLHAELSISLSVITTSYIRNENILRAVTENLQYMKEPVKKVFTDFVSNYKLVDKNISSGIEKMSSKLDNKIFKLWCQSLIICQNDIEHKYSLNAIVGQLDSEKKIQENLSLEIQKPVSEMLILIVVCLFVFPVLVLFGNGVLEILLNTFLGQCITTSYIVCILIALNKAINLSNPIE